MDKYSLPSPPSDLSDYLDYDDPLDFPTPSNTPSPATSPASINNNSSVISTNVPSTTCPSANITSDTYLPCEDAAELEWVSRFVDDSTSFPDLTPTTFPSMEQPIRPDSLFTTSAAPSRPLITPPGSISSPTKKTSSRKRARNSPRPERQEEVSVKRCSHCASEKTPQWRMGPLGPKTLCNACGIRYTAGRLVPEYRPGASPTYISTRHSNSHRKVLELRRQKMWRMQQQQKTQHPRPSKFS